MSTMTMTQEPLLARVPRLVREVREVVDPLIDLPPPHQLATITEFLVAVPLRLSLELSTAWEAAQICHTTEELAEVLSAEDRIVIELVQAMYDHRRSCTVKHDTKLDFTTHTETLREPGVS